MALHGNKEIVVILVEVNDSEVVDFMVPGLFQNEDVDNCPPLLIDLAITDGLICQLDLPQDEIGALRFK